MTAARTAAATVSTATARSRSRSASAVDRAGRQGHDRVAVEPRVRRVDRAGEPGVAALGEQEAVVLGQPGVGQHDGHGGVLHPVRRRGARRAGRAAEEWLAVAAEHVTPGVDHDDGRHPDRARRPVPPSPARPGRAGRATCRSTAPVPGADPAAGQFRAGVARPARRPGRSPRPAARSAPSRRRSDMPITIGTGPAGVGKPVSRSRSSAITPSAAESPNADPPESTTASTRSTSRVGSSSANSRVAGAPPRTSPEPTVPGGRQDHRHAGAGSGPVPGPGGRQLRFSHGPSCPVRGGAFPATARCGSPGHAGPVRRTTSATATIRYGTASTAKATPLPAPVRAGRSRRRRRSCPGRWPSRRAR